ncbi:molybdate ABC transporter substrate-binding protein [uncultured Roseibium sp.]|uniref:molybdate ABC transporter substrate-binding protein n=1 Tax=uncultured Roseibium sp. TaxID=1936171 RepID=UPI002607360B|nr:molybdate ABC transporter substrate-binding protein [uncultured Roseibium sp.]
MFSRLILFFTLLTGPIPFAAAGSDLTVFAAASMREALERIGAAYEANTGTSVVFSFAGTGILARQVEAGAPADVFVSADAAWMDYAVERDAVDPGSVRQIASNALVLIGPADEEPLLLTTEAVGDRLEGERMAIADPDTVPAGRYGKAALEDIGLWQSVSGRLAPMENVRVALASVARGDTPLGLVYRTDAVIEPAVSVLAELPLSSHPEIQYLAAQTGPGSHAAAGAFLEFLTGEQSQEILQSLGFVTDKVE